MWNPFRKQQPQPQVNPLDEFMKAMMQKQAEKEAEEDRPYVSTRIGFGANIRTPTKA
jgi:hypothetical protein